MMIRARNICYTFPGIRSGHTLREVSFDVSSGEILAIVGPSGCGKTTLLRLLTGFLKPQSGEVLLQGQPPRAHYHELGVAFQESRLLPWRNVVQNIELAFELRSREIEPGGIQAILNLMGLIDHQNKLPRELSGGLAERTALARALVAAPEFIFLDEPLGSTDYLKRIEIEDYLKATVKMHRQCCIVITHNLEQAVAVADRILLLGFANRPKPCTAIEIPLSIRQAPASKVRVLPETALFLSSLLEEYKTFAAE